MALVGGLLTRRLWLAASISAPLGWSLAASRLQIRREADRLRITAPQIPFLNGKPLEQLKNGRSVGFISQLSLTAESSILLWHQEDRFVVSYDIFEEKFSATRLGPPRQSVSRLNMPAIQAWCLDSLMPIPPALTPSRYFSIKLELRVEDRKEAAGIVGEPGINLNRLVEIFSNPPRNTQQRWIEPGGPFRLQDL